MVPMTDVLPTKTNYPGHNIFIGRWLGPEIDFGTVMNYKILRPNGGYVCCSTVRAWTPKEEANPVRMSDRVSFMEQHT